MFEKLTLTKMAQDLAAYSGARLGIVSQNVANADTPGYKAMDLPSFAEIYRPAGLDMRATRAGHISAQSEGFESFAHQTRTPSAPNGNSVALETEMVTAANIRRDHEMALAIYKSTSSIIRTSLGRG
jgi:flagellar basal-body rod protein FlgB